MRAYLLFMYIVCVLIIRRGIKEQRKREVEAKYKPWLDKIIKEREYKQSEEYKKYCEVAALRKMCENKNYKHRLPELERAEKEYSEMIKNKSTSNK